MDHYDSDELSLRVPFPTYGPKLTRSHSAPAMFTHIRSEKTAAATDTAQWHGYSTPQPQLHHQSPVSKPAGLTPQRLASEPTDTSQSHPSPSPKVLDKGTVFMVNSSNLLIIR